MFILLTFFFGLGFVSRAAWAWSARPGFLAAQLDRLLLLAVCLIGVGGVIYLLSGPLLRDTFAAPAAFLLAIAAMIVGAALRDLLAREAVSDAAVTQNRNHGIALAAAGLAVIFAAIEHDHAILARLTKFSAGNVSAEFGTSASQQRPTRSFDFNSPVGPAQSGRTYSVDYVAQRLQGFEAWISNDQGYIRLFARRQAGVPSLDQHPAKEMTEFAASIASLGKNLFRLQGYFRSETAPLGIDPALISELRTFYELHLTFPGGKCPWPGETDLSPRSQISVACALLGASRARLASHLQDLDCRVQIELFAVGLDREFSGDCVRKRPGSYDAPSPLVRGLPLTAGWNAPFLDYLAFLLALTEVAAGHAESAIATLDRQLERSVSKFGDLPPSVGQEAAQPVLPVVARVLFLRLGVIQTDLLGFPSNANQNSFEAMLTRGVEWLGIFDDLLQTIDPDRQLRDSIYLKMPTDTEPAKCAFLVHPERQTLWRALFAILAMKNNIAYRASQRPTFFTSRQHRVDTIDRFVADLARLDFRCLGRARTGPNIDEVETAFKHTVGQYLLVRDAELSKATKLNEKHLSKAEQFEGLCRARVAFGQALDAWNRVKIQEQPLDGWRRLDPILKHATQLGIRQSIQEQKELVEQGLRERHQSRCLA